MLRENIPNSGDFPSCQAASFKKGEIPIPTVPAYWIGGAFVLALLSILFCFIIHNRVASLSLTTEKEVVHQGTPFIAKQKIGISLNRVKILIFETEAHKTQKTTNHPHLNAEVSFCAPTPIGFFITGSKSRSIELIPRANDDLGSTLSTEFLSLFSESMENPILNINNAQGDLIFSQKLLGSHTITIPILLLTTWGLVGLSALAFPQLLVHYILLYRAWKLVQPLRDILPHKEKSKILSPAKAVGLLFIPFFNYYWAFVCYRRLAIMGEKYAQHKNLPYLGPSLKWSTGYAIFNIFPLSLFNPLCLYFLDKRYNDMIKSSSLINV